MIKNVLLGLSVATLLWACDTKERAQLQSTVDSLRVELQVSEQREQTLVQIGSLLDSIDANRKLLRANMVEGTSYDNYSSRLKNINDYVRETERKISELEESLKTSTASSGRYAATIKKLRADLEQQSQQMAGLQEEVDRIRMENQQLTRNVGQRDSVITVSQETIRMREQDLANLEKNIDDLTKKTQAEQADLYYAQAQALETAAQRTRFAPRKKKETRREALELYKMALSLGKEEAQPKVDELEEKM